MKIILVLAAFLLASCVEPVPFTVGVCKDGTCINVGGTIPARKSGKEVQPVQ